MNHKSQQYWQNPNKSFRRVTSVVGEGFGAGEEINIRPYRQEEKLFIHFYIYILDATQILNILFKINVLEKMWISNIIFCPKALLVRFTRRL